MKPHELCEAIAGPRWAPLGHTGVPAFRAHHNGFDIYQEPAEDAVPRRWTIATNGPWRCQDVVVKKEDSDTNTEKAWTARNGAIHCWHLWPTDDFPALVDQQGGPLQAICYIIDHHIIKET